jgi:hypothetical protein
VSRRRRGPGSNYLVVRTRDVLGYLEYLGPMYSKHADAQMDAERLYGKPGHTVTAFPWWKVPERIKRLCQE